jgi:hypothetical protein
VTDFKRNTLHAIQQIWNNTVTAQGHLYDEKLKLVDGREVILNLILKKRDGGSGWTDSARYKYRLPAPVNAVINIRVA